MKQAWLFVLGIFLWPILEYGLHRYLGHVLPLKTLFKVEHTRHHAETHYFAPTLYKIIAATPVVGLLFWVFGWGFATGFACMYTFYEWRHWSIHARAPRTKFGLTLRKHHFAHHFHNSKMNHGVTSPWIDRVMGTTLEVPIVRVPAKVAPRWLDSTYAKDFQIK